MTKRKRTIADISPVYVRFYFAFIARNGYTLICGKDGVTPDEELNHIFRPLVLERQESLGFGSGLTDEDLVAIGNAELEDGPIAPKDYKRWLAGWRSKRSGVKGSGVKVTTRVIAPA